MKNSSTKYCECGKRTIYFTNGKVGARTDHSLCQRCFRGLVDGAHAKQMKGVHMDGIMVRILCKESGKVLEERNMPTNPHDWPTWEIAYLLQQKEKLDGVFHVEEWD